MSVFGTRPEAIKMAPLVKALENHEMFESVLCVTAQHRQMLDQVLEIFDLKPDYDLDIMKERQTLEEITVRALTGLGEVMKKAKPDLVLVHGDTSTTFIGSLAAFYNQIKVGHVEAGLRTYNKYEPFPEEMNRKLTGAIADFHFSPTSLARKNLLLENISEENIFITGNTVIDALKSTVEEDYVFQTESLNNIDFKNKRIIAMTAHRRENLGEPLKNICNAVKRIAEEFEDVEFVYAVHKNPAVTEVVYEILGDNERIHLTEPLDLKDMHNLMNRSYFVMTDSGGLQEEVPSMGKPVLVLRNVTERPEGVSAGTLKLAGTDEDVIYKMAKELLINQSLYSSMAQAKNPFGDGFASERIIEAILYCFGKVKEKPTDFNINNKEAEGMKEERMAILSMIEKGIISVEEAERLFDAVERKRESDVGDKLGKFFSKAGDGLSTIAKTVGEKTEKLVEESKPVVKKAGEKLDKAIEEAKPAMKKAVDTVAEKTENLKKTYENKKHEAKSDYEADESDFEEDVIIIPFEEAKASQEEVKEEMQEEVKEETKEEN